MVKLPPIKSEPSEYDPDDTARQLVMINTCLQVRGGVTERYQELDPSVQDENEVENIEKSLCLPEHEEQEEDKLKNSANSVDNVKKVADV